jgi:glycerophosphoryl diester phosphodiesterase
VSLSSITLASQELEIIGLFFSVPDAALTHRQESVMIKKNGSHCSSFTLRLSLYFTVLTAVYSASICRASVEGTSTDRASISRAPAVSKVSDKGLSAQLVNRPLVIAHRGASGYLPEHSLESKVLAFAQDADFIEQDLVMTKDNQIVVLHDYTLNRVSDVAQKFPQRARADGQYYVIDFTLEELRTLAMTNGYSVNNSGQTIPDWPERFSVLTSHFRIHTFAEEIELIQELNRLFHKDIGIYPEIKSPWFHRQEGKDISRYVLDILKHYGYTHMQSRIFLQSFDPNELVRIDKVLLPEYKMDIPLVQLMAQTSWFETYEQDKAGVWKPYDYQWMFEPGAMAKIQGYAEGIGPWKSFIINAADNEIGYEITTLVAQAQAQGLVVHPYTFRVDRNKIAPWASSFEDMVRVFVNEAKIDGLFTDFPDKAKTALLK